MNKFSMNYKTLTDKDIALFTEEMNYRKKDI